MIKVSAPGKMILIGEYAVLDGAPALVYAVNRRAVVSIRFIDGNEFSVYSPSLGITRQAFVLTPAGEVRFDPQLDLFIVHRLDFFRRIFESTYQFLLNAGIRLPGLALNLNTDAFYSPELNSKYGFGSSAALTVALVRALFAASGKDVDSTKIFSASLKIHHQAQGNLGSGIDIAASNFGGILIYERTLPEPANLKIPQKVTEWKDMYIFPIWTGHSASTRKMVKGVNRLREENPHLYDEIIKQLSEISTAGCKAYQVCKAEDFLKAVRSFYQVLDMLGKKSAMPIISEEHRQLHEIVHALGGSYKPSGAGSGDIGIAFSNDPAVAEKIRRKFQEEKITLLDITMASEGLSLEANV